MSAITHVLYVLLDAGDAPAARRLRTALEALCAQDPALDLEIGPDDIVGLRGISEAQLEWMVLHLQRQPGLIFTVSKPQVLYRETITHAIDWSYTHKQRDPGQYAKLRMMLTPLARSAGIETEIRCRPEDLPPHIALSDLQHAIDTGILAACRTGVIAGWPVTDMQVHVLEIGWHNTDSATTAFEIAARMGMREALPKARPWLLEPMMLVVALTPMEFLGEVIGDLNARRGQVHGMEEHGALCAVTALVPLATLIGYENVLRVLTRGRGSCAMAFDHYEQAPPHASGDDNFPMAAAMRA